MSFSLYVISEKADDLRVYKQTTPNGEGNYYIFYPLIYVKKTSDCGFVLNRCEIVLYENKLSRGFRWMKSYGKETALKFDKLSSGQTHVGFISHVIAQKILQECIDMNVQNEQHHAKQYEVATYNPTVIMQRVF